MKQRKNLLYVQTNLPTFVTFFHPKASCSFQKVTRKTRNEVTDSSYHIHFQTTKDQYKFGTIDSNIKQQALDIVSFIRNRNTTILSWSMSKRKSLSREISYIVDTEKHVDNSTEFQR